MSAAAGGSLCGLKAGPLAVVPGGGGGPPPKFTSRITGAAFVAFAGVVTITVIFWASGFVPTVPTTFFRTAAPSRAFGSVSATCQLTFGVFAGVRP